MEVTDIDLATNDIKRFRRDSSGLPKRPLYFSRKTPSTMLGVKRFYFS